MDDQTSPTLAAGPSSPAPGADEDWSGQTLGDFRILRLLGRGGMGQVYLAEQTSLKRKVAVKMLRPELAANKTALARFRTEAEAVARLSHANIVQIYAIGEQNGVHFMVLEYVEGRNLRDYLNRKGSPDLPVCLSLMRQIAAGLQRAHEAGFIHRDVKPENVLLTRKGEAKVTDFGLTRAFAENGSPASITQSGVAMGTPLYMSPEQVQGKPVDLRCDIYSFGVTCYTMLAGTPPFRGASAFDVAVQHVQNEAPPLASLRPDLPPELCTLVHRMMAKNPDDRPQSFKDVLRDLNRMRDSMTGAVTMPPLALPVSGSIEIPTVPAVSFDQAETEPLRPRTKWLPRLIAGAALAAVFFFGVTVRVVRNKLLAKPASVAAAPEKVQPIVSNEERFALDAARQYADPSTSDSRELKRGLDFQIDLAAYYFKRDRLDDAEQFFKELRDRKYKPMPKDSTHPYLALGQLGQALVLAFRDQPQALDQLGRLVEKRPGPAMGGAFMQPLQIAGVNMAVFDHPDLRRLIVEALNRIAVAQKVDKFDKYPQLDLLRKPSRPRPFGRG